jgi:dodecin
MLHKMQLMRTIREIHGIEIKDMTATIDQSTGKITQYRTAVKLSFGVEHSK